MIVLPVLMGVLLGFALRPARRAQGAVAFLVSALAVTLWFAVARDDGEAANFVASLAGLWALCAVAAAAGGVLARRRGR